MDLLALAKAIGDLGTPTLLALILLLLVTGKVHSESEVQQLRSDADSAKADLTSALVYRETLRQETLADRKAADERLSSYIEVTRESNELLRRSIDLNEKLVEDYVRPKTTRTRRSTP